jgi:hypothetical protein
MKRLLSRLLLTAMVAASIGVVGAGQGAHAATTCPPDIVDTTVSDDVVVPAGQTCTIKNSTVSGTVTVQSGGSLNIFGSTINGDVIAKQPGLIQIDALAPCSGGTCPRLTVINGNVTISGAAAGAHYICNDSTINGDLAIRNSAPGATWEIGSPRCAAADGNTFNGFVTLTGNQGNIKFDNNAVDASVTVRGNTGGGEVMTNDIGGDLTVRNNTPCYIVSGNTVGGTTNVSPCP